ncbi:MAG: glucose-1-phosphate adenylyltransferase [Deltaproteobacteria bacterium]|nr:glucose-1-phosphate adenylyltransferase [Deltaproteobacteria bacterium]
MARTLVMIMAGGKGTRLAPLTSHRAKPAVPFGGRYRIIDFVLSNFVNSGYYRIHVLTQYMASSLIRHLNVTWNLGGILPDQFIEPVPAQMRRGEHWYVGTADSVYQNLNLIHDDHAEHVAVFGGDHIYKIAVDQMEAHHVAMDADLTVAAFPVPKEEAHHFGVIQVDAAGRITGFQEKPKTDPATIPGQPDSCLVSMGNYFFKRKVLEEVLVLDAERTDSSHDFGKDIIPQMVKAGARVFTYDFATNRVPGESADAKPYWRDVGTLDSYFEATMDLRAVLPAFNLYNRKWPIRSVPSQLPPAKFVLAGKQREFGQVVDSLVCEGTIVSGAMLVGTIAGLDCYFHRFASIENSVFCGRDRVGRHCWVKNVLADTNVVISEGTTIGFDPDADKKRFPFVTDKGIIILPKGTFVPKEGPIEIAQDMVSMLEQDPSTSEVIANAKGLFVRSTRHSNDAIR